MVTKNEVIVTKTILVLWDFSEVSEYALLHAVNFAQKTDNTVTLLHIVDKGGLLKNKSKKTQETITATNNLNILSKECSLKTGLDINFIVLEGSIFTTIADAALQFDVSIIVMGIHGMKGAQKIAGSWAIKVIYSSHLPFLVVQAPLVRTELRNIIFPVDETEETLEKCKWAQYLHKYFDIKFRIVNQHLPGQTKVSSNIAVLRKVFLKYNLQFDIYDPHGKKNFVDDVSGFASRIDADMILIMIKKDIRLTDFILGIDEQNLIFNKHKIPVMCINSRNKV